MTTTTTAATAAKPKQITCGINEADKALVKAFSEELTRPAAVKGASDVGASEREIIAIALKIATDCRFQEVETVEDFLDVEENELGEYIEVTRTRPGVAIVDLFEIEWEVIKAAYDTPASRVSKVSTLQSELADAKAELEALKAAMAANAARAV
jgi:hypothetical protein